MEHDETKLPRWAWQRLCQYRKALMDAFERIRELETRPDTQEWSQEFGAPGKDWSVDAWCEIDGAPKDACGRCAYWLSGICALDDSRKAPETAGCSQFAREIFIKFI